MWVGGQQPALRSPRDPHQLALGSPEVTTRSSIQACFKETVMKPTPSDVPQQVKEGSDRWPRNALLEEQSFLLLWKEDVKRCAPSPHSCPHEGVSLVYHCPSSAVPITRTGVLVRIATKPPPSFQNLDRHYYLVGVSSRSPPGSGRAQSSGAPLPASFLAPARGPHAGGARIRAQLPACCGLRAPRSPFFLCALPRSSRSQAERPAF